jgi:hypothetical protein
MGLGGLRQLGFALVSYKEPVPSNEDFLGRLQHLLSAKGYYLTFCNRNRNWKPHRRWRFTGIERGGMVEVTRCARPHDRTVNVSVQASIYFEKFFEVARSIGDLRVLDIARYNLGMARAAALQKEFLEVVDGDLEKLLNWKNLRISFTDQM